MKVRVITFLLALVIVIPLFSSNVIAVDGLFCGDITSQYDACSYSSPSRCDFNGGDDVTCPSGTACVQTNSAQDIEGLYCLDPSNGCAKDSDCPSNSCDLDTFTCNPTQTETINGYVCNYDYINDEYWETGRGSYNANSATYNVEITVDGCKQTVSSRYVSLTTIKTRTCQEGTMPSQLGNNIYCVDEQLGCTLDSQCGQGYCDLNRFICSGQTYKEECSADLLCISGLDCVSGICELDIPSVGDSCSNNYDCGELVCNTGTCKERTSLQDLSNEGFDGGWYYQRGTSRGDFLWNINNQHSSYLSPIDLKLCDSSSKRDRDAMNRVWYARVDANTEIPILFKNTHTGGQNTLDGRAVLFVYDMQGKLVDRIDTNDYTTTSDITLHAPKRISMTIPDPGWYRFVFAFREPSQSSDNTEAYCHAQFDASLISMFEDVDSGKFVDSQGNPIQDIPGRKVTSKITEDFAAFSFFLEPEEWKSFDNLPFEIGGAIVSCERVTPFYSISPDNTALAVKANHKMSDPAQCNAFVWSRNIEENDLEGLDFIYGEFTGGDRLNEEVITFDYPLIDSIIGCNSDKPGFYTGEDFVAYWRNNEQYPDCGVIAFSQVEGSENFYVDLPYARLSIYTQKNIVSESFENDATVFGFETANGNSIDGAVVKCTDGVKSRYNIVDRDVYVYTERNVQTDCTVFAWEFDDRYDPNAPPIAEECPANFCDSASDEGKICTENGFYTTCVYDENVLDYAAIQLFGIPGEVNENANSAFKVPYDANIGEGRNDVVSDYNKFYQCLDIGNAVLPPPITSSCTQFMSDFFFRNIEVCDADTQINCCENNDPIDYQNLNRCLNSCTIEDDTTPGESLSSQEVRDRILGYGIDLNNQPIDDSTDTCDYNDPSCGTTDPDIRYAETCEEGVVNGEEIKECSNGCEFQVINTFTNLPLNLEAQTYCCAAEYGDDPCGQVPECPGENWIEYGGLEECSGEVQEINGEYCCLGEKSTINIPESYTPIACNLIGDEAVGYSCENYAQTSDLSILDWGMSTSKISNQLQGQFKKIEYNGASAGIEEKIIFLEENYLFRHDWSTAEFLEFDFKIIESEDRKFSFTPTNFYLKINDNDYAIADASKYLVGKINDVYRIRIPLKSSENMNLDYSNVQSIGVGTNDRFFPKEVIFALDNIKLIDEENTPFICGFKDFVVDPDVYDENNLAEKLASRYACEIPEDHPLKEVNPLSWTGTQCCGDDIRFSGLSSSYISQETYYKEFTEFGEWQISDDPYNTPPYLSSAGTANYFAVIEDDGFLESPIIPVRIYNTTGALNITLIVGSTNPELGGALILTVSYYNDNSLVTSQTYFVETYAGVLTAEVHKFSISEFALPNYSEINGVKLKIQSLDSVYGYPAQYEYRIHYLYFDQAVLDANEESTVDFEYYTDSNSACFMGKEIGESRNVGTILKNNEYKNLMYTGGEFRLCDFYETGINPYEDIFLTDEYGNPTSAPLIDSSYTGMCKTFGTSTCTGDGWSSYPITFDLEEERQGFAAGTTVYCGEDGQLYEPEIKFDWYLNDSKGCFANSCYCPFEECGETNNGCVFENISIGDRYCQAGDWTTRTAFAARLISEKMDLAETETGQDGLLSCGSDIEVLNFQNTQEYNTGCFYSNLAEAPRQRVFIVATPLNGGLESLRTFVTEEFAEIYSASIDGSEFDAELCLNQIMNSNSQLQKCDAGEVIVSGKPMTIYYDETHNIVYVSNDDSLSESTWGGFIDFWRDLFNIGETYDSLSTDFDEVYLFRKGGNSVEAYTNTYLDEGAIVDHRSIKIDFTNETKESQVVEYARQREGVSITPQDSSRIITFNDRDSLWSLLTTSSRYQLD